MAAVLASGPGAVLSHRAAGALHRIHNSERLEVTVARPRRPLRAIQQILDKLSLPDLIARYPRRHGIKAIKSALAQLQFGANVPKKELEKRFRTFTDQFGLQRPESNAYVYACGRWFECDCVWRAQRVIVELDGRQAHGTTAAFESDHERDRILQAEGWRVVRITWRQLHDHPDSVAKDLRCLLG